MEVILLKHVESLGRRGEVVKVRPGYARNFLLPRRMAVLATIGAKRLVEQESRKFAEIDQRAREGANTVAEKLSEASVTIAVKADEEGKLYGSVGPLDVHAALEQQGFEIPRKNVVLDQHIKKLGDYDVPVKLHLDVRGSVKVSVVQE